jgi:hypothetical protein
MERSVERLLAYAIRRAGPTHRERGAGLGCWAEVLGC